MKSNWIDKNSNWFEGAGPGVPSTNNALESINNDIKNSFTFRARLPMNEFLELCLRLVRKWSEDRNSPDVLIYKSVPISQALEAESFKFASEKIVIHNEDDFYYFNYDCKIKLTIGDLKKYQKSVEKKSAKNFDEYAFWFDSIACVSLKKDNWKQGYCLCETFQKEYICVHLMGLAIRLRLLTASHEAVDLAMGKKRKCGPKKGARGGKALIID